MGSARPGPCGFSRRTAIRQALLKKSVIARTLEPSEKRLGPHLGPRFLTQWQEHLWGCAGKPESFKTKLDNIDCRELIALEKGVVESPQRPCKRTEAEPMNKRRICGALEATRTMRRPVRSPSSQKRGGGGLSAPRHRHAAHHGGDQAVMDELASCSLSPAFQVDRMHAS